MKDLHVKKNKPKYQLAYGRLLDAAETHEDFCELSGQRVPQALAAVGYSIVNALPAELLELFGDERVPHQPGFGLLTGPRGGTFVYLSVYANERHVAWVVPLARAKARRWLSRSLAAGRFVFGFASPDAMRFSVRSMWHPEMSEGGRKELEHAARGVSDSDPGLEYVELLIELREKPHIARELAGVGIEERWLVAVDLNPEGAGQTRKRAAEAEGVLH